MAASVPDVRSGPKQLVLRLVEDLRALPDGAGGGGAVAGLAAADLLGLRDEALDPRRVRRGGLVPVRVRPLGAPVRAVGRRRDLRRPRHERPRAAGLLPAALLLALDVGPDAEKVALAVAAAVVAVRRGPAARSIPSAPAARAEDSLDEGEDEQDHEATDDVAARAHLDRRLVAVDHHPRQDLHALGERAALGVRLHANEVARRNLRRRRVRRVVGELVDPPPDVGKSRIWPTLDLTINSEPRYLFIVFAFAGDSTMTRDLPITLQT